MKIDVGSSAIVDVIKEFSIVVNPNWKTQDGNDWKDQFTNVTKLITNYNYVCWCVEGQRGSLQSLQSSMTRGSLKFIATLSFE
jgi:hypothetical protein